MENNLIKYGESKLKENRIDPSLAKYLYKYLDNLDEYENAIDKLIEGKPVQYIVGNVDFYGLNIKVNENVLIPRFETEELVDKTIKYINNYFDNKLDIVDIGTGSGAIAITLKSNLDCNMDAVDISKEALEVARINAKENNVEIMENKLLARELYTKVEIGDIIPEEYLQTIAIILAKVYTMKGKKL